MNLPIYSLILFFVWYMLNIADISKSYAQSVINRLHPKVAYAIRCGFCLSFHITLVLWIFGGAPWFYVFAAPVLTLFLVKLHSFLSMEVHTSP